MIFYMLAAILFLLIGHIFKARRWQLFVGVYEAVPQSRLTSSLAVSYLLNFYLPLHVGDAFRIWLVGRKMHNGLGYATSTVIVDRVLDVLSVTLIFLGMAFFAPSAAIHSAAVRYVLLALVLILLLIIAMRFNRTTKKIALRICSIFNDKIRFRLLFFLWALISSFKDIFGKVKKGRLLLDTALMWTAYLCSYALVAAMFHAVSFSDIMLMMFSSGAILRPTFFAIRGVLGGDGLLILSVYILAPLLLLVAISALTHIRHAQPSPNAPTLQLLPQLKTSEQLNFLDSYFAGNSRQALHEYLSMNADVGILRDYSAGSAATTMLCVRDGKTIFRKYAVGDAAAKLMDQAAWLHSHASVLPLPEIILEKRGSRSFCYDMRYDNDGIGMFQYVYSHPIESSWEILQRLLGDLTATLYRTPVRMVSAADIKSYLAEKVARNLKIITQSRTLRDLTEPDYLIINGVQKRNLPLLLPMLDEAHLTEIFSGEQITDVHGDLTLENIICYTGGTHDSPYYFIDPNPANPIKTASLDLAKLFQSLHGKYEFLAQGSPVQLHANCIDFLLPQPPQYEALFERLQEWLCSALGEMGLRRVFYHEIVHWLRLMPYRITHNASTAPRYYAAMILIMNDIYEKYESDGKA